jgi:hypothetical protein
MDKLDRDGTFPDPRRNTLDGAVANISHGENSGHVGFKKPRIAIELPSPRRLAILHQIGPGQNKSARVALNDSVQPSGARLGANEDESELAGTV